MTNPLYDALFAPHAGSERPFLELPGAGMVTYGAFVERAARLATVLSELGLAPGDRLAVQVEKSPDALALYAASVQNGVVLLPLNTAYTPAELAYFVENSDAALFVCDPGKADALAGIAESAGARLETLGTQGDGSLARAADTASPRKEVAERSEDDLAALLYTSGTTGRSKGAMLSQRNLLSNAEALRALWGFTEDDVLLHALPIYHTHGLFVATNVMLLAGGSMIFLPKFDVDAVIEALPRATAMMGVPTFYTRLLDDPRLNRDLVAHMRLFISGSAPLLPETHRAWEARTGHRILERYGMTETGMNSSNPLEGARKPGTVGLPLPGVELRVTDPETGAELAPGEIGMVEVRGPNVFQGYWRMPEKTAEEFRDDGFFITGDLGMFDEDGYLTIVGRGKDLIISGGLNVYPREVEEAIDAVPGVKESAVIGAPHPDFGEGVVAVVVREPGASVSPEDIAAALKERLAAFKRPKRIEFVDELPRNTMGKVQKNVLRERYREMFAT